MLILSSTPQNLRWSLFPLAKKQSVITQKPDREQYIRKRKCHKSVTCVWSPPESDPPALIRWSSEVEPRARSSRHKHRSPFPTALFCKKFNRMFSELVQWAPPMQLDRERHLFWSDDASLSQICPDLQSTSLQTRLSAVDCRSRVHCTTTRSVIPIWQRRLPINP